MPQTKSQRFDTTVGSEGDICWVFCEADFRFSLQLSLDWQNTQRRCEKKNKIDFQWDNNNTPTTAKTKLRLPVYYDGLLSTSNFQVCRNCFSNSAEMNAIIFFSLYHPLKDSSPWYLNYNDCNHTEIQWVERKADTEIIGTFLGGRFGNNEGSSQHHGA